MKNKKDDFKVLFSEGFDNNLMELFEYLAKIYPSYALKDNLERVIRGINFSNFKLLSKEGFIELEERFEYFDKNKPITKEYLRLKPKGYDLIIGYQSLITNRLLKNLTKILIGVGVLQILLAVLLYFK